MRTRRCSWETGLRCQAPATQIVRATYLGAPLDHDVLFCDDHASKAHTLIREGYAITSIDPITADTKIRNRPKRKRQETTTA